MRSVKAERIFSRILFATRPLDNCQDSALVAGFRATEYSGWWRSAVPGNFI